MNSRVVQLVVGFACTIVFLALTLYGAPLEAVSAALANANPLWIGRAMVLYAVNLGLRAWRWQLILRSVAAISYPSVGRALLVGYGLNTLLPARLGELFRAEYLKKTCGLSRVWILASIIIERLFDAITVVTCLGLGLLLAAPTQQNAGILLSVLVTASILFGTIAIVAFYLSGQVMPRVLRRLSGVSAQLAMVQRGFEILRSGRIAAVVAFTLLIYVPDGLSLWCLVKAVGLTLGFADGLVLVGAASLSTLVPSGPAFLGTLQFAYALAIEFGGSSRATGIAAATLAQVCLLFPVAIAAVSIIAHGSGRLAYSMLVKQRQQPE